MKKLFYLAIMAITLGVFTSCGPSASVGPEPEIDEENATIDGKKYDNLTSYCWYFEGKYTEKCTGESAESDTDTKYFWGTEFFANKYKAEWDWSHNVSASAYGVKCTVSGSSKLTKVNKSDNDCY